MSTSTKESMLKNFHPNKNNNLIPPKPEDPPGHGYWCYFHAYQDTELISGWKWIPLVTIDDINLNVNVNNKQK